MSATTKLNGTGEIRPPQWSPIRRLKRSRTLFWLTRDLRGFVHRVQRRRIVHVLHVGKTGGMAINAALEAYGKSGDYEIRTYCHDFVLKSAPRGEKVVFFLRDPISRFVSAFYYRKRLSAPRFLHAWTAAERAAFARFETACELAAALSSDDPVLRSAAQDAMRDIEHIRSHQWTWFETESYFRSRRSDILFIGFQETLNADFEILKKILGLPEQAKLTDDDVAANRSPKGMLTQLNSEAIRNLEVWYSKDYHFLAMCRQIATEIRSDFEQRTSHSARLASPVTAGQFDESADRPDGNGRCDFQSSSLGEV